MTRPTIASFATIALSMLCTGVAAEVLRDDVLVCRGMPDDGARLACYDAAVDRSRQRSADGRDSAAAASPAPVAAAAAQQVPESTAAAAAGAAAPISQEALFGKNTDAVQRSIEEATGNPVLDSLSGEIAGLQQVGYDKVLITLDNGQIWRQVDASQLRLRTGDSVVIERAALGSFMLKKQGSKRTMRVSRED